MKKTLALLILIALTLSMLCVLTSCGDCDHVDDDKNYVCDECGEDLDHDCVDEDVNCKCDLCGDDLPCTTHIDRDSDFNCDNCKEYCGPATLLPENYMTYVDPEYNVFASNSTGTDINELNEYEYQSYSVNLALFRNYNSYTGAYTYKVLNVDTGTVVFTDTYYSSSYSSYSYTLTYGFIKKVSSSTDSYSGITTYTTTIYNASGVEVAYVTSRNSEDVTYNSQYDLYCFGGKYYTYEDGVATKVFENEFVSLPSFTYINDSYMYRSSGDAIYVYGRSDFDLDFEFILPYNDDCEWYVLQNGNIFVQYFVDLDEDAQDYDLFDYGDKCDIYNLIIDVKTGEATYIDFNYIVDNITAYNDDLKEYGVVANSFTNLARLTKIVDKRETNETFYVDVDNDMKLVAFADKTITAQYGTVRPFAEDRYIVSNKAGKSYLVDGKGNMIGEITNYSTQYGYIALGNKLYDKDLNFIIDLTAYTNVGSGNGYAIFSQRQYNSYSSYVNYYYILKDASFTELSAMRGASNVSISGDFFKYRLTNNSSYYTTYTDYFCNIKGEVIMSFDSSASAVCRSVGDALIFSYNSSYSTGTKLNKIVKIAEK